MEEKKGAKEIIYIWLIIFFCAIGFFIRIYKLGNPFQSSDNSALATRIILNKNFLWMLKEYFGLLISLIVKLFTAFLSTIGIIVTEFWFKFPIALIGTLQIPLTYVFLRHLGCSYFSSSMGAGLISVFPIHVMLSRFLWGYEVIGVFFITLTFLSLIRLFNNPSKLNAILFYIFTALYLISHGYILPFFPTLIVGIWSLVKNNLIPSFKRLQSNIKLLLSFKYWIIPFLFLPLTAPAIVHTFRKDTRIGFFFPYHFKEYIKNTGIGLTIVISLSLFLILVLPRKELFKSIFLFLSGCFYLFPLFFGAPPGVTVSRDYMLVGTFFLVLLFTYIADKILRAEKIKILVFTVILISTGLGIVTSLFFPDIKFLSSGIKVGRGGIEDFGIKSAGYLIQNYLPLYIPILAIHRNIEPENLYFYFKRKEFAFYDLTLEESLMVFLRYKKKVDIVICDAEQRKELKKEKEFEERVVLYNKKMQPLLFILTRKGVDIPLPSLKTHVSKFNKEFDKKFGWKVSFW